MRLYVAGKYEERARIREVMDQLEAVGHTITYDWTTNCELVPNQALKDFEGVCDADAFILVAERDVSYCGTLVELGVALACDIPIFVLGHALDDRCIFLKLPAIIKGIDTLLE